MHARSVQSWLSTLLRDMYGIDMGVEGVDDVLGLHGKGSDVKRDEMADFLVGVPEKHS